MKRETAARVTVIVPMTIVGIIHAVVARSDEADMSEEADIQRITSSRPVLDGTIVHENDRL